MIILWTTGNIWLSYLDLPVDISITKMWKCGNGGERKGLVTAIPKWSIHLSWKNVSSTPKLEFIV